MGDESEGAAGGHGPARVDVEAARRGNAEHRHQAQKMDAIGRLAGHVAHDFNELLGALTGLADGPSREGLDAVKKATERAATLVEQLLAVACGQSLSPRVLDVNALVRELEPLARGLVRRDDVSLLLVLDERVARVRADAAQLQRALMNLVVNARDAMHAGGHLRLTTANVALDAASLTPGASSGPYVRISVEDDGVGMSRETAARALEPFFTTKESSNSSGLGLSTAYGIVTQSGGLLRLDSASGRGTSVHLFLPAVDAAPVSPVAPPAGGARAPGEPAATVLLVEDEEAVRQLVRRILESRGYQVLLARHGGEALELVHQVDLRIDLLLTDAVMPVLSGPELLRRAIALRPTMKVAIMSGYTDRPAVKGVPFIGKPFTPAELERRVREILDAPTPTPHPLHK